MINWWGLSGNPAAMHLLEAHPDKIEWRRLSVNPAAVWLDRAPAGTVDRLQALNCVADGTPTLSDQQRSWLLAAYGGVGPCAAPAGSVDVRPMPGWEGDAALWDGAVLPYCATCHMAMPEVPIVQSAEAFRALDLATEVGGPSPTMPHAFATFTRLWAGDAPAGQEMLTAP
jgi:hypothetical protein